MTIWYSRTFLYGTCINGGNNSPLQSIIETNHYIDSVSDNNIQGNLFIMDLQRLFIDLWINVEYILFLVFCKHKIELFQIIVYLKNICIIEIKAKHFLIDNIIFLSFSLKIWVRISKYESVYIYFMYDMICMYCYSK